MVLGWTTSLEFFIYFLPYSKLLSLQIPANCRAKHRVIVTKHPKVIIQRHYQCANNKSPIVKPSRCILLASPRLNSKLCLLSSSTGLPKSPCVLVEEKIGCLQGVWGDGKHCTGNRETRVLKACVTLSKTLDCLCLILPSFKMCAFPPLPQFLKLNGSSSLLSPITLWNLVFILIIFQGLWASSCALFLSTRITTSTCLCNWFLGQEKPLDKPGLPRVCWINAWSMDFLPPSLTRPQGSELNASRSAAVGIAGAEVLLFLCFVTHSLWWAMKRLGSRQSWIISCPILPLRSWKLATSTTLCTEA